MGVIWINGTDDSADPPFSASCPDDSVLLPITRSPTTSSPTRPTKSPTVHCPAYSELDCPSDKCYYQNPNATLVDAALSKYSLTKQASCKTVDLGCRSKLPLCKYRCLKLCNLDPNCHLVVKSGKQVCKPIKPTPTPKPTAGT
jgi:hypothetical protein